MESIENKQLAEVQQNGKQIIPQAQQNGIDKADSQRIATQTKAIGIIYPPPDIRAMIDKTAEFIAKHGRSLEARIVATNKNNVKFNFLVPSDPYHQYYQYKIKVELGEESEDVLQPQAIQLGDGQLAKQQQEKKPQPLFIAGANLNFDQTRDLEKPDDVKYLVHVPEGLSAFDLDTIKNTSQFVARNGAEFLKTLQRRQSTDPMFNFLKATHSMFTFFTSLTDAYFEVMMLQPDVIEKLRRDATDRTQILERCLKRLTWERAKEREARQLADEQEKERLSMQMIDWHDFVVVETIEFDDEEDQDLGQPLTFQQILALNKANQYLEEEEKDAEEAEKEKEKDKEMDESERALMEEAQQAEKRQQEVQQQQDQEAKEREEQLERERALREPKEKMMEVINEDEEEDEEAQKKIKIVKDYQRVHRGQVYDTTKYTISPITSELVPVQNMAEHMKVHLTDPRWKEQRDAMLAKIRDTTKAADEEIARNLIRLADTRPDIFGSTQEEVSQAVQVNIKQNPKNPNEPLQEGSTQAQTSDGRQINLTLPQQPRVVQPSQASQQPNKTIQIPQIRPPQLQSQGLPPPPQIKPPNTLQPPRGLMPPQQGTGLPSVPIIRPPGYQQQNIQQQMGQLQQQQRMLEEQPDAKRQRLAENFVLTPESEFMDKFQGTSKVKVQCPQRQEGQEGMNGQLLDIEVPSLQDTVGDFKQRLQDILDIPSKKINLLRSEIGILGNDNYSLAYYNISPDIILQMRIKERGRKK